MFALLENALHGGTRQLPLDNPISIDLPWYTMMSAPIIATLMGILFRC